MFKHTIGTDNAPYQAKGLLGKALVLGNSVPVVAYSLKENIEHASVFINVLNIDVNVANVMIYVSDQAVLTDVDLIEQGVQISPTGLLTRSIVRMSAGESIYVISTANIVVRVEGYEGVVM